MAQAQFCSFWHVSTGSLFSDLPEEDKDKMEGVLTHISIKKRNLVYSAGDAADMVYVLMEGRVKITRLTEDGRELTLDILGPGDIFGELALTGETEREASAEALEDSMLCAIKKEDFISLASRSPLFSLSVTKWIGGRLRRIENRLEDLIFRDVRTRILTLFSDLAEKYGEPAEGGTRIAIKLSHQEIANLIGSTRETVTAELNSLKKKGEIIVEDKHYIIPG